MYARKGVALHTDGKEVARRDNAATVAQNDEALCLGREVWGGDPASTDNPAFFRGSLADVQIWPRALSAGDIAHLAQP